MSEPRLPKLLLDELSGCDWRLDKGGKHWKLIVNGKLAGIIPKHTKDDGNWRAPLNTRTNIRRILALTEVAHCNTVIK
jgi:hypothetical protein